MSEAIGALVLGRGQFGTVRRHGRPLVIHDVIHRREKIRAIP
jgi:hypothetical protein